MLFNSLNLYSWLVWFTIIGFMLKLKHPECLHIIGEWLRYKRSFNICGECDVVVIYYTLIVLKVLNEIINNNWVFQFETHGFLLLSQSSVTIFMRISKKKVCQSSQCFQKGFWKWLMFSFLLGSFLRTLFFCYAYILYETHSAFFVQ